VSLTAWFKLPEQGMKQYDVLSQASAIPVRSKNSLQFLTSQHVVLPWLYKYYYAAEWLEYVKQEHTAYTIECREGNRIVSQYKLCPESIYRHPKRDVVALSLDPTHEALFLNHSSFGGLVTLSSNKLEKGDPAVVAGYEIDAALYKFDPVLDDNPLIADFVSANDIENHNGFREQVPINMSGCRYSGTRGPQHFLKTPHVLVEGMCGGGVFGGDESQVSHDRNSAAACHGIIEGIVPLNSPAAPELAGHASYIDSVSLLEWLDER
jgi:hypothetical protein